MTNLRKIARRVANQIPEFDKCFDPEMVVKVELVIPEAYAALEEAIGESVDWPTRIESMTPEEIAEGEMIGGGHGMCFKEEGIVKINSHMDIINILINFIHENLHYAMPDEDEKEIDRLTDVVYEKVTGMKISEIP